ncbi:MAG: MFS transporter [Synergistaceae bacterium]|jgi:MFS family permease|nr:MFS transporter [Synergistaceae bacterium]
MIWKDKTLIGLNLSVFLMMICNGMMVATLPQRIIALDGHGQNVGYLASMFAAAYIALQVPVGAMADRFGFKTFLVAGYLLCFLAGMCFYYSASSAAIFCTRMIQGAGEVPIWALPPALLSLKYPRNKGAVMGAYNAIFHIGLTTGPILGVFLAAIWAPEKFFLLYAFACLTGAAAISRFVDDVRPEGKVTGAYDMAAILRLSRDGKVFIALLGITLYGSGYGIFLTTMPAYLLQEKGFGATDTGMFFSLFFVAISAAQVFTGRLSDRFGPRVFMIAGLAVAGLGLGVTPHVRYFGILAMLTTASLGLGVFYLASMIFLNETVDENLKGTISGAYYLFWGVGMLFGPPALSNIAGYCGYGASLAVYALMFILAAAAVAVKLPRKAV